MTSRTAVQLQERNMRVCVATALQGEERGAAGQGVCRGGGGGEDRLVGSPLTPLHAFAFAGKEGTEKRVSDCRGMLRLLSSLFPA